MKDNHLRGIILAAVLLTLGAGVALAQLTITIEPACIECCPLQELGPCPGYTAWVRSAGWRVSERLDLVLTGPGPSGPFGTFGFLVADDRGMLELQLIFMCENPWPAESEATVQFENNYWWVHPEWKPADHGLWTLQISGQSGEAEGQFLFAEDCVLATHVPEPETVVLLSGGLAGLAGYTALRVRNRRR